MFAEGDTGAMTAANAGGIARIFARANAGDSVSVTPLLTRGLLHLREKSYFRSGPKNRSAELRVAGPLVRLPPEDTVTLFASRVEPIER